MANPLNESEINNLRNLIQVRDIIRRTENPNPIFILFIIIIILTVMYYIFISFIKTSITGVWIDANDINHNIVHNKWKDTIIVDGKYHGVCKGYIVIIYMNGQVTIGICNNNKIKWTDGSTWNCSYGYESEHNS